MTCKLYCEHGALRSELRQWRAAGRLELVYFPYDPGSKTSKIAADAVPSDAQWRDLENLTWNDLKALGSSWNDFSGSDCLAQIRGILGPENRRDALHVDSAYKHGCHGFITRDADILDRRAALESLLPVRFFHPDNDWEILSRFIDAECGAA